MKGTNDRDEVAVSYRIGRTLGRSIYRQTGLEPSKYDTYVGMMETRELAAMVVDALNGPPAGTWMLDPAEVGIVRTEAGEVLAYEWTRR